MIDRGKELLDTADHGSTSTPRGLAQACLQIGVGVVVVPLVCVVLAPIWRFAGDENHRLAMGAARSLDGAQDAPQRVQAIRELAGSAVIDGEVAILPLVRSMDDPDVRVRVAARENGAPTAPPRL
jgi:hypothetical protein